MIVDEFEDSFEPDVVDDEEDQLSMDMSDVQGMGTRALWDLWHKVRRLEQDIERELKRRSDDDGE